MGTTIYDFPPFPGFSQEAFGFLRELPENNDRDWFEARRSIYEDEVRYPLKCLIADVARRLKETELLLTGHPTSSRFQIYRDLRFTDDSRPYKSNVGAVFDREGDKSGDGVIYVHVEAGDCFLAGGFYRPSVPYLKPVRTSMASDPDQFFELMDTMDSRGLPLGSMDDTLTGMPRGFHDERDQEISPYLRWKHFVTERSYDESALQSSEFAEEVVEFGREIEPLLSYVWELEEEGTV